MAKLLYSVAFVSILILSARVEAAVLCAKKAKTGDPLGAVSIREACKKNELQLDPVRLGLQQPSAVVKDANGVTLGIYTPPGFNSTASVLMNIEGMLLLTRTMSLGFPDFVDTYYTSQDCSGPGFVGSSFVPANSGFSNVLGGTILGTLFYYVDSTSPQTTITVSSRGSSFSFITGPEQCSSPQFFLSPHTCCLPVSPVETPEMRPLNTLPVPDFVPPFHVEMQP
jgi:hypothetical protein